MKHGGHVRGGLLVITPVLSPVTPLEPPLLGPPGSRGRLASRGLLSLAFCPRAVPDEELLLCSSGCPA